MYQEYPVPTELVPFVRRILVADEPNEVAVSSEVRPTGYSFLGYVFRGKGQARIGDRVEFDASICRLHLSGQVVAEDITVHFGGQLGHILAEFTGLGCYELLGVEGGDFVDRSLHPASVRAELGSVFDADYWFSGTDDTKQAIERLLDALKNLAREKHAVPAYLRDGLVHMEGQFGQVNLAAMCESLGVSPRHFNRQFCRFVGQPPKRFCRILQVNRALQALMDEDATNLAAIAHDAGFSDQSHFNRVFQKQFLTNPLAFLDSDVLLLRDFLADSATNPAERSA